jgi:hypothetical protein
MIPVFFMLGNRGHIRFDFFLQFANTVIMFLELIQYKKARRVPHGFKYGGHL